MDNEKIYEVEKIEFIFYDYLSFPKAERTSFYITLLNIPLLLSDFDKKLIVNYANTVSLEIYKQWIASGKVIALNEIINRAIILTSSGIQGFFEK